MSTVLSALSILKGTVTGFRSIHSIRKRLNKKKNNDNNVIPLEEVPLATIQDQLTISDRRTDSSEMTPENLDQTRNQLVAVTDLSELGDVEKILCISPNGYAVEITPDQLLEYDCP